MTSPKWIVSLALTLPSCTPRAISVGADRPASPDAAVGRLAGPPAALRVGVVDAPGEAPATTPSTHDGHSMPSNPAATNPEPQPVDTKPTDKKPADTMKPVDDPHEDHDKKPADTKKPIDNPHKGHDKKPADGKKPADNPHKKDHEGHRGHAS